MNKIGETIRSHTRNIVHNTKHSLEKINKERLFVVTSISLLAQAVISACAGNTVIATEPMPPSNGQDSFPTSESTPTNIAPSLTLTLTATVHPTNTATSTALPFEKQEFTPTGPPVTIKAESTQPPPEPPPTDPPEPTQVPVTNTPQPTNTPKPPPTEIPPTKSPKPDILTEEVWQNMSSEVRKKAIIVDKWFRSVQLENFSSDESAKLHFYSVVYLSNVRNNHPEFEQNHPGVDLPNGLVDGLSGKLPKYMTYIVNNTGNGNYNSYRGKYGAPYGALLDLNTLNRSEASEEARYLAVIAMLAKEEVTNDIIDQLVWSKLPDMSVERIDNLGYAGFLAVIEDLQASGLQTAQDPLIKEYYDFIKGLYLNVPLTLNSRQRTNKEFATALQTLYSRNSVDSLNNGTQPKDVDIQGEIDKLHRQIARARNPQTANRLHLKLLSLQNSLHA